MLYEIHAFVTGAENVLGGEDEPDPNDFADNADYEAAMKEYNTMIERLNKGIRLCKAWVVDFTEVTGFFGQSPAYHKCNS